MSQPGLHILLEVKVLQWVKLTSASCHNMTISRNWICHVEVINIFNQWSTIQFCLAIWLMSKFLET